MAVSHPSFMGGRDGAKSLTLVAWHARSMRFLLTIEEIEDDLRGFE